MTPDVDRLLDEIYAADLNTAKQNFTKIFAEILARILVATEILLYGEPKS